MPWVFEGTVLPECGVGRVELPGPEPVVALPGRYAVRGLVDGHCHLTLARGDGFPYVDAAGTEARLEGLAADGVTLVRDVGGDRAITLRLAREPRRGTPRVLAAGRFLAPRHRYFPGLFVPVEGDDLAEAVRAEVRDGATWVKLVADFPELHGTTATAPASASYGFEVVPAAVEAAHALGARVAAHTTTTAVSDLVRAGVDSIEHGDELTPADLEQLGARGGAWTPTLSSAFDTTSMSAEDQRALAAQMAVLLPLARRTGVTVLAGSDITGTVAGEIAWLHRLGLTIEEALDAAGPSARRYLDAPDEGDLATFDDDPRAAPDVLARPVAVVVRGHRVR